MAAKINISDLKFDTYSDKSIKSFTEKLADSGSTLEVGSTAAAVCAMSAALVIRAIKKSGLDTPEAQKAVDSIERMRGYFVVLTDEEIKAVDPLRKRMAAGASDAEIEAGYRTACTIIGEMMYSIIDVMEQLSHFAPELCPCAAADALSAVFLARAGLDSIRVKLAYYATKLNEAVYARTTHREPEIAIADSAPMLDGMVKTLEAKLAL